MDLKKYGMILYDGTILINKIYTLIPSKSNAFIIFFTLLHELMHALSRLFRGDKNFFVCTDEFFKKNGLKYVKGSGDFFDKKILLDALPKHEITEYKAKYLLDSKNYNIETADDFKLKFINFRKAHWGSIKNLPTFYIGKTSEIKTYSIKIRCNLGSSRNIK